MALLCLPHDRIHITLARDFSSERAPPGSAESCQEAHSLNATSGRGITGGKGSAKGCVEQLFQYRSWHDRSSIDSEHVRLYLEKSDVHGPDSTWTPRTIEQRSWMGQTGNVRCIDGIIRSRKNYIIRCTSATQGTWYYPRVYSGGWS